MRGPRLWGVAATACMARACVLGEASLVLDRSWLPRPPEDARLYWVPGGLHWPAGWLHEGTEQTGHHHVCLRAGGKDRKRFRGWHGVMRAAVATAEGPSRSFNHCVHVCAFAFPKRLRPLWLEKW